MQLSNYHSHCTFCDGRSIPEDFVRFAISQNFRAYGFSSHAPLPFETFWNMSKDNMQDYLAEINRLKCKYQESIEIYVGLEIDYLDDTYNASIPYFKQLPLDYRISSIHFLPVGTSLEEKNMACIDGPFKDFESSVAKYYDGNISNMIDHFFDNTMKMIESGGFDIIGHMDKIYMNGSRCNGFSFDTSHYKDAINAILERVSSKNIMIEINTKNLTRKNHTYPHYNYIKRLKELNIPVMVNSDCHYPDLVNDGRELAFNLLKSNGFTHTRELIKGTWEDIPLR